MDIASKKRPIGVFLKPKVSIEVDNLLRRFLRRIDACKNETEKKNENYSLI